MNKTVDDNLKLLVNSFGNNKGSYLYSAEWSDTKYNLAIEIIDKHDVFSGYKQTETWLSQYRELEQLQCLQQLERLEVTNLNYEAFSGIEDAIFYLDPPYENTTHKAYKGGFDSQTFYDWAFEMSKKNIVLISSYEISDDRFKCVYEFDKARSTMQSGVAGKTEKLFMAV